MIELTTEQQERIAREIMGWRTVSDLWIDRDGEWIFDLPYQCSPDWLWPLETALIERFSDIKWDRRADGFSLLLEDDGEEFTHPTRGDCLIEAALSILPEVAETGSSLAAEVGV